MRLATKEPSASYTTQCPAKRSGLQRWEDCRGYLRPSNIDQALTHVHRERGEAWAAQNVAYVSNCPWARSRGLQGRQAIIELYRAWEGLVDELLATSSCATLLLVDPQDD